MEHKGIRDIENLFKEVASTDEDYCKPKESNSAFNNNYIEYENRGDKYKNFSLKEYLYMIILYLRDMINDHKAPMKLKVHSSNEIIDYETQFGEWKFQLIVVTSFISSIDSEETRTWHTNSNNIEIMMGSETDEIIKELFKSLLQNYQKGFEESERTGSSFKFEIVDLLYYHLHKTSLKRGKSYTKSPEWLENKRATINPKNNDDNCF